MDSLRLDVDVRVPNGPEPVWELVGCMNQLLRHVASGTKPPGWHRVDIATIRPNLERLREVSGLLTALASQVTPCPEDDLDSFDRAAARLAGVSRAGGLGVGRGTELDPAVFDDLRDVHQAALLPFQHSFLQFYEQAKQAVAKSILEVGLRATVVRLSSIGHEEPTGVCVPAQRQSSEIERIDLIPSIFVSPGMQFSSRAGDTLALAFSAPGWADPGRRKQFEVPLALEALVGATRASVLECTVAAVSTSGLAERIGISISSASQHAATLRGAGLVESIRRRNFVFHRLTPLGHTLLRASSDAGARVGSPP